ncbi:MAG TPA: response regulator [Bacteroidota bacterium]|nr:response regulator [Bacteroidota bacterium]
MEQRSDETVAKRTILVVEDDEMLLDLLASVLEEHGYTVLLARDGLESVELFKQHHGEIALVLTDMGLPHLGGWEAFLEMKKIDPNVKTMMASGYFNPSLKAEMLRAGAQDFVQKPYVMEDVLRKINELIGPARGKS